MTEKEYKAFEQWSRDMRDVTNRNLEIAKERCNAQLILFNLFETYIEAMRQATEREEKSRVHISPAGNVST